MSAILLVNVGLELMQYKNEAPTQTFVGFCNTFLPHICGEALRMTGWQAIEELNLCQIC